jgi:hypothetical protein
MTKMMHEDIEIENYSTERKIVKRIMNNDGMFSSNFSSFSLIVTFSVEIFHFPNYRGKKLSPNISSTFSYPFELSLSRAASYA